MPTTLIAVGDDVNLVHLPVLPDFEHNLNDILQHTGRSFWDKDKNVRGFFLAMEAAVSLDGRMAKAGHDNLINHLEDFHTMLLVFGKTSEGAMRMFARFYEQKRNGEVMWQPDDEEIKRLNKCDWDEYRVRDTDNCFKFPIIDVVWQAYKFSQIYDPRGKE